MNFLKEPYDPTWVKRHSSRKSIHDEMDRYDKGWGALQSFIEEIEAERNSSESSDLR